MKRRRLALALGALLMTASVGNVQAAAPDPLKSALWPLDYVGSYYFYAEMSAGWMRTAINAANTTIGHRSTRNPDFHPTTSSSAKGKIRYRAASQNSCDGSFTWTACADAYSDFTWRLWLSSEKCWTDGSNNTCSSGTKYDVQTVALNEMGHINRLSHHLPTTRHDDNPDYDDAVVQLIPDPVGSTHPFGVNRAIRWADHAALYSRYGPDPCTTPPCPLGVDS